MRDHAFQVERERNGRKDDGHPLERLGRREMLKNPKQWDGLRQVW
jgi:hypothetical protein